MVARPDRPLIAGARVLIVEDLAIVSKALTQTLSRAGCEVVGPFEGLSEGLEAARATPIDCALLDIRLNGDRSYPIARALQDRRVPFAFITGYTPEQIPHDLRHAPTLEKPFGSQELVRMVQFLIGRAVRAEPEPEVAAGQEENFNPTSDDR